MGAEILIREILRKANPSAWIVWVVRKMSRSQWQVGFYSPDKRWHAESRHSDEDGAFARLEELKGVV